MRGKIVLRAGGAILAVCCLVAVAAADVKLPGVFGDHMVLQREMPVPVWGWADPAEQVTVTLGEQSKTATADGAGKWCVKFDPIKAGGPLELKVQGKTNSVQFTDVLVGEVWLCSGQSNMAMSVSGVTNKDAEIASADYPKIRLYTVDRKPAAEPQGQLRRRLATLQPEDRGRFLGRRLLLRPRAAQATRRAGRVDRFLVGRHADRDLDQRQGPGGRSRVETIGRELAAADRGLRRRESERAIRKAVGRLGKGSRQG